MAQSIGFACVSMRLFEAEITSTMMAGEPVTRTLPDMRVPPIVTASSRYSTS